MSSPSKYIISSCLVFNEAVLLAGALHSMYSLGKEKQDVSGNGQVFIIETSGVEKLKPNSIRNLKP